jgi:4-hydroxy-3-methylbut-2-enyl diphosphate reductase
MKIITGKWIGFCSGVKRAMRLIENINSQKTIMLGPLIHNRRVVETLEKKGIKITRNLEEVKEGYTVVIPSHGCLKEERESLLKKKINLVDATCPIVRKLQKLSEKLKEEGYKVVIVGDKEHPEVKGVKSYAGENSIVLSNLKEADKLEGDKIAVVFQTTSSLDSFKEFSRALADRGKEVRIFNTLCKETVERQKEAILLAKKSECVIVIGGKNSANTKRIFELCSKVNKMTYHIENAYEINEKWLEGKNSLFITSGTSTPDEVVNEVIETVKKYEGERGEEYGRKEARSNN